MVSPHPSYSHSNVQKMTISEEKKNIQLVNKKLRGPVLSSNLIATHNQKTFLQVWYMKKSATAHDGAR